MFLIRILECAIVISITHCNSLANSNQNQRLPNGSPIAPSSPITVGDSGQPNVTFSDKSSIDRVKFENQREFPPSARNSDTPYRGSNDYDYESMFPANDDVPSLPECILSRSEFYLSWWVNEDGTLKVNPTNRSGSAGFADLSLTFHSEDMMIKHVAQMTTDNPSDVITFMSIASNELDRLPLGTLTLVNVSLQYLSLANNNFNLLFAKHNKTFQSWSSFPLMINLKELDLRNCSITEFEYDVFKNLPRLEKLFLSNNLLVSISPKTFENLKYLSHLDLSYNKVKPPFGYNLDPFSLYLSGLQLDEGVFNKLNSLTFLDLSHTKLKQESVRALTTLGGRVEQLSLCYTEIPLIVPGMFSHTNLKVLDLSGNPSLTPNLQPTWFNGLESKLEILIFQNSNLKNISPLRNLMKLRMLDLENNNINQISASNFMNFGDLEILDLSSNHISNWYSRVFTSNTRLKIVNLRKNNINLMTPQMMHDFNRISFLAIGANNFVCDCSLREFIDRAAFNARMHQCASRRTKRAIPEEFYDPKYHYEVFLREFHMYIRYMEESYKNIIGELQADAEANLFRSLPDFTEVSEISAASCNRSGHDSPMEFDFLLLDYSENDYHCIESDGLAKKKLFFNEVETCPYASSSEEDSQEISTEEGDPLYDDKKNQRTQAPNNLLLIYISVSIPLTFLGALWFWKRKDIKYFFAIFKNTLILSFDKDDQKALMMTNRRRKSNLSDDYRFDLFVSYSEKDRSFVLDQLIPNLEKRSEIRICLHERDFQVGLSILENIIQCMDQSRCLLLVVSESFIKSNWCSFEMHLAQHRLIETRREQLILVLLQDIPKGRRPRTLSFLMRTKTYIMWPEEDKEDLRNIFWRRLKKAITLNNWEPERKIKPRHSIV